MHPVRSGAAVGNHVHTEFAARRFHRDIDLARRHPYSLGDDLEMVDQALHGVTHDLGDVLGGVAQPVRAEFEVGGPRELLVADHHRCTAALFESLDALFDDAQRLAHLLDPDQVPPVGVTAVIGDDIEIVCLVTTIGLRLTQVMG